MVEGLKPFIWDLTTLFLPLHNCMFFTKGAIPKANVLLVKAVFFRLFYLQFHRNIPKQCDESNHQCSSNEMVPNLNSGVQFRIKANFTEQMTGLRES